RTTYRACPVAYQRQSTFRRRLRVGARSRAPVGCCPRRAGISGVGNLVKFSDSRYFNTIRSMTENRRDFLKKLTILAGATGMAGTIPPAIQRALAIRPAPGSTYLDAEHIVILMQENRSFDHALGTLKGVRGFND